MTWPHRFADPHALPRTRARRSMRRRRPKATTCWNSIDGRVFERFSRLAVGRRAERRTRLELPGHYAAAARRGAAAGRVRAAAHHAGQHRRRRDQHRRRRPRDVPERRRRDADRVDPPRRRAGRCRRSSTSSTREPAGRRESRAARPEREGQIVGLANHTVLIARDGTERPIDDSAAPIRDAAGARRRGGAGVPRRHRAQQTLEAQARLAAIVESSEDAIVSKTLDGIIRSWNAGPSGSSATPPEEAIGRPINLIIPPDRVDEEHAIMDRLRRGERVEHFETVRQAKDGRLVELSVAVSPVRDCRRAGSSARRRSPATSRERKRIEEALQDGGPPEGRVPGAAGPRAAGTRWRRCATACR